MEQKPKDAMIDDAAAEHFAARVAALLNSSTEGLPPHVEARLNSMRANAMIRVSGQEDFVRNAGLTLASGEGVENLPVEVRGRLDDIRAQALQRAGRKLRTQRPSPVVGLLTWLRARLIGTELGIPAGAFASVCLLMMTLAVFSLREPDEVLPVAMLEEGLVLASGDDIELYANLEFYQWLAENGL